MAELYRRLRPHPVWSDIEYSIRGDVRRFLKLQVGDGLNPQFMFSSGQRRATGIAFLLSVNLSIAWSRWNTVLLDDPVQHIDDFRSIHLAEVIAQLLEEGRQIICAVEDPALADLLGRRLPIRRAGSGKRITLGADPTGALSIREERRLQPLVQGPWLLESTLRQVSSLEWMLTDAALFACADAMNSMQPIQLDHPNFDRIRPNILTTQCGSLQVGRC